MKSTISFESAFNHEQLSQDNEYVLPSIYDEKNKVGFYREHYLSSSLREFLGLNEDIKYVRNDVTKKVIDYCKQQVDPEDKTKIIIDWKLFSLTGGEIGKQITFFEAQKLLHKHFLKN